MRNGPRYREERNSYLRRLTTLAAQVDAREVGVERQIASIRADIQSSMTSRLRESEQLHATYLQHVRDLTNRGNELEAQVQQQSRDLAAARAVQNNDGDISNPITDRLHRYDSLRVILIHLQSCPFDGYCVDKNVGG
jgi:septal ring factor EnvC (AmiA/AmiB activator)